ncbi:hypothetical protein ANO11243_080370 [Dothideomycetidae sp. 11243]|nr:hypothetical protein ANO11243_080370 [fungal sp. No.11243]
MEVYSLEKNIESFFETQTDASRLECESLARSQMGSAKPAAIQGACSFTLVGDEDVKSGKVVQFRSSKEPLDAGILRLAKDTHGDFVPDIRSLGLLGKEKPVSAWMMTKVDGLPLIQGNLRDGRLLKTATDFGRFFAQAWLHPQPHSNDQLECAYQKMHARLLTMQQSLPIRFQKAIVQTLSDLHCLYQVDFPQTLAHGDLCMMNIMVDPQSGGLNGIIDWAAASIGPFGLGLYGLDSLLGTMDSKGWHYHADAVAIEDSFWRAFRDSVGLIHHNDVCRIKIGRTLGILLRYGYTWDVTLQDIRPLNDQDADSDAAYLDVGLAHLETKQTL